MSTRMDKILAEYLIDAAEDWYKWEVRCIGYIDTDKYVRVESMLLEGVSEDVSTVDILTDNKRFSQIIQNASDRIGNDYNIGSFRRLSCITILIEELREILEEHNEV